jgi:glyoxylase-like metal-dependent hydrolase (beta-lactamase superfamily II)
MAQQNPAFIRQLFEPVSSTYTYFVWDSATFDAVVIDSVRETSARDLKLIKELGLRVLYTVDTHVHADHVTNAGPMHDELNLSLNDAGHKCQIVLSKHSNAPADMHVELGSKIHFGSRYLEVRPTPGHTDGCISLVLDDHSAVFTGDAMLIRGCGRTDFQQGNSRTLYNSIFTQIYTLPDSCVVYPGHDYTGQTSSTVGEEKQHNVRLFATQTEAGFVELMANLKLQPPKQIDIAVPANMRNGYPIA